MANLTLDGVDAALKTIAAGEMSGDTLQHAAAAMGYLLAGCVAQAAKQRDQRDRSSSLTCCLALRPPATAAELLAGVARLRTLLQTPADGLRRS